MPKRAQVVEIYAPVAGLKYDAPSTLIDLRAMPDGSNNKLSVGINRKEYGLSLYSTATLGAPVTALFDAKFAAGSILQVLTNTGVFRHSSTADTFVSDGQTFSGTASDYWAGCMYNNAFVYANGIGSLQVKPTFSTTGTAMASSITPTTFSAYALAPYREHLCLYHTIENGTHYSSRVKWSKKGALVYSAGTTDFASGTAGALDIMEAHGEIKTAVPLGITMAIYCEHCIIIQTWVGGDEIYRFTKTVEGLGTPSRRGAVSHGDVNYFISRTGFYSYYGGDDYREIGAPIRDKAFTEINQDALATSFVEYDASDRTVLFHVPTVTSTSPNKVWVYKETSGEWTTLSRSLTCAGNSSRHDATTIGSLVGKIGDLDVSIGDYYLSEGSISYLYGTTDGRVLRKDATVHSVVESGVTVGQAYSYVTPDIVGVTATGKKVTDPIDDDATNYTAWIKRYTRFTIACTGNGQANAYFSVDKGATWRELAGSPFTMSPSGTMHQFDMDYCSRQMRYRVSCSGTNSPIGIEYAKVNLIPQGVV